MATVALTGLRATTSQGDLYAYVQWRAALVLPKLSASGTMHVNPTMAGAMQLPRLIARGYGGATANLVLPALRVTAGITIPNILRGNLLLPTVTGGGTGLTGMLMSGALVLPTLSGVGYCGAKAALVLPKLIAGGAGKVAEHMTGAIMLPKLRSSGVGHRTSETMSGAIILPHLVIGQQVRNLPIVLPALLVHGSMTNVGVATAQAWVMNVKNKAVTKFTNFPFRTFVRWNNKYYGVGMEGGLYLLEGDTDAGAAIPWSWETGLDDMGSNAQKGVSGIYIEGTIEPGATITLIDDKKQRYVYPLHAVSAVADRRTYRVVTGKGIRTRNIGVGMASALGGFMEVNQVAPKLVVSKRNIG